MSLAKKLSDQPLPWFKLGMVSIFLISVALRFWGLSRFNTLVFDEVYYAIFARNYLTHTHFFDGHPPLSKYIIAIGMWLGNLMPFGKDAVNDLTGSHFSTFSYRWLNALTGSFIPLVVAAIAYQLNHRRSYALIAGLFAACDGLFLVESRYALNNVYLDILGLLGHLFFLLALSVKGRRRWSWLALSGVWFGASACIKWNGLWFLFGAYLIWIGAWLMKWVRELRSRQQGVSRQQSKDSVSLLSKMPLQNLTQLNLFHIVFNLGIIPLLVYSVLWIPHIQLNPEYGLWEVQKEILSYHQRVGGNNVHPYCSPWYTWLLMIRPVAYFYHTARNTSEIVPTFPPLPAGAGKVIYDVHAMGNPILWWLSTAAILLLLLLVIKGFLSADGFFKNPPTRSSWLVLYLVINWLANLIPWLDVKRCTFLYHYMGSSLFAGLGLAWIVDRWLSSNQPHWRTAGFTAICLILVAFIFWMPIYLGLPLSPEGYKLRMWFPSWI